MMAPLPSSPRKSCRSSIAALALAAICVAATVRAEDARPRVIETPALKLFGDGTTRLALDLGKHRIHALLPSTGDVPEEGDRVTLGFSKDA